MGQSMVIHSVMNQTKKTIATVSSAATVVALARRTHIGSFRIAWCVNVSSGTAQTSMFWKRTILEILVMRLLAYAASEIIKEDS